MKEPAFATARRIAPALLIGVFALLLRAPLAAIPLERDEGEYAYIAQRWLLGEIPYASTFDQKPPGAMAIYAAILRTLGESATAIHWGAALLGLITLASIGLCARRLGGARAAWAAPMLLAFLLAERTLLGQSANTETFVALFISAALAATLAARDFLERDRLWLVLGAGALSGAALLCKPVAFTSVLFCFLLLLHGRRFKLLAAALLGLALPLLATAAYFARHGALSQLLDASIFYNLGYARHLDAALAWRRFLDSYLPILGSTWALHLLALIAIVRRAPGAKLAAAWLCFSFLGVAIGGHFREHYFLQAAPALALLAGLGLAALPLRPLHCAGAAAAALIAGLAAHPGYWLPGDAIDKARAIYGANPFPESAEAGALLSRRLGADERIFVLGSEPELLFAAKRESSTRYIFFYPLSDDSPEASARQAEVISELRSHPPRAIVAVFQATSLHEGSDKIDPALFVFTRELLANGFRPIAVAPFATGELLEGEEAAQLWRERPFWYGEPAWASLAVFLRQ